VWKLLPNCSNTTSTKVSREVMAWHKLVEINWGAFKVERAAQKETKSEQHWETLFRQLNLVLTLKNSADRAALGVAAGVAVEVRVSVYERETEGVEDFVTEKEVVGVTEGATKGWKEGTRAKDGPGLGLRDSDRGKAVGVDDSCGVGSGSSWVRVTVGVGGALAKEIVGA